MYGKALFCCACYWEYYVADDGMYLHIVCLPRIYVVCESDFEFDGDVMRSIPTNANCEVGVVYILHEWLLVVFLECRGIIAFLWVGAESISAPHACTL